MKIILEEIAHDVSAFLRLKDMPPWVKDIQDFLDEWFSPKDYLVLTTSGSTGNPKAIRLAKTSIKKSAEITNRYFDLIEGKVGLLCLPVKYIAGKMMVIRALEGNWNLILEEPSSYPLKMDNLALDFIALTPHQVSSVIQDFPDRFDDIKELIIGGSSVSFNLRKQLQSVATTCYQTYGMTETITHIALQQLNGLNQKENFIALDEFELDVDDRGCLVIKADHIYQKKVATNDLVKLKDQQQFQWLGRIDNVINSAGIKISPEVVEQKIKELMICPFFIAGETDNNLGKRTVLCVESLPWRNEKKAKLLKQIESRLHKYEVPRSILFFDCFLYTPSGKIQRSQTLATAERE